MAYTDFAQSQEDQARKNQQFWDQWWTKFNPPTPMATPTSAAPQFDQASENTRRALAEQAGSGGVPGSFDISGANRNIGNEAQQKTRTMDLHSYLDAMKENAQRENQLGSFDFQKTNQIGDAERRLGSLPTQRRGANIQTQDAIKAMWDAYRMGQNPWENLAGGALGSLGGDMLADLFDPTKKDEMSGAVGGALGGGR